MGLVPASSKAFIFSSARSLDRSIACLDLVMQVMEIAPSKPYFCYFHGDPDILRDGSRLECKKF
jgi:hypothetical protein